MRPEHWRAITAYAVGQDGLVTASQLRLTGATTSEINDALAQRKLTRVRHGIVAVTGVPTSPTRATRAAALVSPKSVVSHRSAGWLHGLLQLPPPKVELTAPVGVKVNLTGVVGANAVVRPDERREHASIPVTTPARTLVDLSKVLAPDWVERLLHDAVMRRLCSYTDVVESARRNKARSFAETLHDLVGESPLEAKWHRILCAAGLRPPARQHQVVIGGHVYLLDFAWPEARFAIEVDGYSAHSTRAAFDRDRDKALALRAAGWTVVNVTSRTDPAAVLTLAHRQIRPFHRDSPCGKGA